MNIELRPPAADFKLLQPRWGSLPNADSKALLTVPSGSVVTFDTVSQFLNEKLGLDRATALACLSAGADFQVTQVVDRVKGVNAMIGKADFAEAAKEN